MSQTYNTTDLNQNDGTSIDWALSWARFISKDKPINGVFPQYSMEDEEWLALLTATALSADTDYDGTAETYYIPWEAVATKILTDPEYASQLTEDGYTALYRTAGEMASFIRSTFPKQLKDAYPSNLSLGSVSLSFAPRF